MKFGFFDNGVGFRGTTRAIIEYAKIAQSIQKDIEPIFYFNKKLKTNDLRICRQMINSGIEVKPIDSREQLINEEIDLLYHVSSSDINGTKWLADLKYKTLLHQVGYQDPDQMNPDLFAYTSYWQSYYFTASKSLVLPYIVNAPSDKEPTKKDARAKLNIPEEYIVLMRHGGFDTWNLPFASKAIVDMLKIRKDIVYIFLNTPKFVEHENAIFYEGTDSNDIITTLISASDAMIHARWEGETFGLACSEFLIRKKPIITWAGSRERNQILMADNSVITYNTYIDLLHLLGNISKDFLNSKSDLIPLKQLHSFYGREAVKNIMADIIYQ